MTAYRLYELPDGRTAESFNYQIDAFHGGHEVDELVTDDRDDAFRILGATLEQSYGARFRSGSETRYFDEVDHPVSGTGESVFARSLKDKH